ncbi:hypothetical protein CAOG_04680, partial [Capsaspora owczarzaki ATCC 30864]|uniref:Uncharacterized protein n=1 Tax=Capsaspora owczarzaki (strain ATCC 30864) TaxID=595528 RepID=A0A0D2UFR0_CAPO3
MLSYQSMTERQRMVHDRVKNAKGQHYLDFSWIGDAEAQAIAEALKVNTKLTTLELNKNQIGDVGAQALAEALKVNTRLNFLQLSENQIGDAGAQSIAEALKVNKKLTFLFLADNQFGDAGAKAIAEALKVNTKLTTIDLMSNCIGKLGSQALKEACKGKSGFQLLIHRQINPLAFSLLPRLASAEDIQEVLRMLTSGVELEDEPASLPTLPIEIAEVIMDKACYWHGAWKIQRDYIDPVKIKPSQGNSIRVKTIQVFRDWEERPHDVDECVFRLTVHDERGKVRYKCAVHPTFATSNLDVATLLPASHPFLREMREGWQAQILRNDSVGDVRFESLYIGYF